MKFVCVLRSGGDFTIDDVDRLACSIRRHVPLPIDFYCLTDVSLARLSVTGIMVTWEKLQHDWPSWWAKMEMFRIHGPAIYFDLDTVILGDIGRLIAAVEELDVNIMMLGRFVDTPGPYNSGIMGWRGDSTHIYDTFCKRVAVGSFYHTNTGIDRFGCEGTNFRGDQDWLTAHISERQMTTTTVQTVQPGVLSYKNDVVKDPDFDPGTATIVCFHGKPRPADVTPAPAWLGAAL